MSRKNKKKANNKENKLSNNYIDPDEYVEKEDDNNIIINKELKSLSKDEYITSDGEDKAENSIDEEASKTAVEDSDNVNDTEMVEHDIQEDLHETTLNEEKDSLLQDETKSDLKEIKNIDTPYTGLKESDLVYEGDAYIPTVIIKKEEIEEALNQNLQEDALDSTEDNKQETKDDNLFDYDTSASPKYISGSNDYDYEELDFETDYVGNSENYDDENPDEPQDVTKYDNHGFAKFTGEVMADAHSVAKKYAIVLVAVILVIAGVILLYINKKSDKGIIAVSENSVNDLLSSESTNEIISDATEELKVDAYTEINELIYKYFEAMKTCDFDTLSAIDDSTLSSIEHAKIVAKAEYVEDYKNIEIFTKAGPYENSYIAYVKYEVKLKNWEKLAPSLLTLLVCAKEDGGLYLYSGDLDENIAEYIKTASSSQDVVDLINKVEAEYKEALDSDVEFSDYMNALNQTIKDDVGEMIAAEKANEASSNDVSLNDVSNNDASSNDVSENGTSETYEVKANTTVNVRVSDSENADKLGKAEQGMILTCTGEKPNGWSSVIFEGQTAYIKTEFLTKVESDADDNNQAATTGESKGTVRVKETVNIRSKASTESGLVGVAYMGETFPLLEIQSDGWSKINYNGQVAYVKTEFLEQQ